VGWDVVEKIGLRQFRNAEGVEDWRILSEGAFAFFPAGSFAHADLLVDAIAKIPDLDAHHPDVDLRHDGVTVKLLTVTNDYWGLSDRDVELAREISRLARELGFEADPTAVETLLIVPGAPKAADVMPFWEAVLGYQRRVDTPEEDLVDGGFRNASFWFEQMDEPRGDGLGAIHVAVFVPYEIAQARVDAALAAGGRLVRDHSPQWWTLADPAGNEADIATTMGRD
jgi:4a-hydroxytetrahydrobiopterin dehydratase